MAVYTFDSFVFFLPFSLPSNKMSCSMSTRKLLKLKHKLDSLDLNTQQLGVGVQQLELIYTPFGLELKMKIRLNSSLCQLKNPYENNEVNFDLPPKFDEYEEH